MRLLSYRARGIFLVAIVRLRELLSDAATVRSYYCSRGRFSSFTVTSRYYNGSVSFCVRGTQLLFVTEFYSILVEQN